MAPNGKLTAASILDSKGITLGKEDRVGVEKDGTDTVLRVQRVTHGTTQRVVAVSYQKITVEDPNLAEGTTQVRQAGKNGASTQTLAVTYVDGKAETEMVTGAVTTTLPTEEIIAVGTKKPETTQNDNDSADDADTSDAAGADSSSDAKKGTDADDSTDSKSDAKDSDSSDSSTSKGSAAGSGSSSSSSGSSSGSSSNSSGSGSSSGSSGSGSNSSGSSSSGSSSGSSSSSSNGSSSSGSSSGSNSSGSSSSSSAASGHLTPAEAKSLAKGMARDFYGWGTSEYNCLVTLWNNESGWRWNADNPWSDAYGIPQALPGSKMGAGWQHDAALQIRWGLSYIKNRYDYGTPCKALAKWNSRSPHWY